MLRKYLISVLISFPIMTLADTVAVPNEFTSGNTISSSEMNANFKVLADESNENDLRITQAETTVQGLETLHQTSSYVWLGYTTNVMPVSNDNEGNTYNLTQHCRIEFGASALAGSLSNLAALVEGGGLIPPPETVAMVAPGRSWVSLGSAITDTYWGVSTTSQPGYCILTSSMEISSCTYPSNLWAGAPVACVSTQ